jgi:hypothetical protein
VAVFITPKPSQDASRPHVLINAVADGLLRFFEAKGHVHAHAAAIDLPGAQVGESEGLCRHSSLFGYMAKRLERLDGFRNKTFHASLHVRSPLSHPLGLLRHHLDEARRGNVTGKSGRLRRQEGEYL